MHRSAFPLLVCFCLGLPVQAGSSNSLMDVSADGKWLLVANSDNNTVTVVDTTARKAVHEITVGDKPEGVTWIGKSTLAVVTVYRDDKLVFIDGAKGTILETLSVPDEPYGIIATRDGSRAYVTHEYPGLVSEIDLEARKVLRTLPAGKMPRGIAFSPDEKRVYVTEFYAGVLNAIDLEKGEIVDSWSGHSTDNLSRNVVVHPTLPKAYLPHIRSKIKVNDGSGSIFPQLTIYDLVPPEKDKKRRTSIALDSFNAVYIVTNPWEAALSPDGKRIYTLYAGTNDMNVSAVLDDNYREIERIGGAVGVGQNPRAVRVSPDNETVYVYNALDFDISVFSAKNMRRVARIKVCEPAKTPEWVRGKILFSTANRPMTRRRWIACASCHPDGHHDGRVWRNPEGMRDTPPFMGMAHTHPLHWSADRDEVQDFEYTIRGRLMQGYGLLKGQIKRKNGFHPTEREEKLAGRSSDLDAMAIYCNSFTFTLSPHNPEPGKLSAEAERGKKLFLSEEVGCAKCHSGPYYSNSSLSQANVHDIGTGRDEFEKIGTKFDTPTLLGVYRSAPYLHDGQAATLRDVLTTCNKDDKHGKTSHLREEEIDDLVAFLKALPYELPPDETPNTVEHRVKPKKE